MILKFPARTSSTFMNTQSPGKSNRAFRVLLLVLFACGVQACAKPELAEVSGTVTHEGKPIPNLKVVFIPEYSDGTTAPYTFAFTNADGQFRLETAEGDKGSLLGTYRVLIQDITVGRPGGVARSRVPPAYDTAIRTPLTGIKIRSGTQTLNFELESLN